MIKVVRGLSIIDVPWNPSPLVSPVSSLHHRPHQFPQLMSLRGSTLSYAGVTHFPKHSLEYSLNFWSQSRKKIDVSAEVPLDPLVDGSRVRGRSPT